MVQLIWLPAGTMTSPAGLIHSQALIPIGGSALGSFMADQAEAHDV